MLAQIPGPLASVTADGVHDGEPVYRAVASRQPEPPVAVVVSHARERRLDRVSYLGAFLFASLATMAKGPVGIVLPAAALLAALVVTGRLRVLSRIPLGGGVVLVLAATLPWYVASFVRHGAAFTDELVFRHMIGRATSHLHDTNAGDGTSLAAALVRAAAARQRSVVVVVSDFRGPQDWRRPLLELAARHEVVAVEIRDPREEALPNVGWERARLADIEPQLDGSGNLVDVLAAGAGSANKGHCEFRIWNEYGQMLSPE